MMQEPTPEICSVCQGPTTSEFEYTKGLYVCSLCADEQEVWWRNYPNMEDE